MCIAMPGKVTEIQGHKAKIDFGGTEISANIMMIDAQVGDYVLVHAGCAIEVLAESRAQELISIFQELDELEEEV